MMPFSTRATSTLPPSAIRYGRTSSSTMSTFSIVSSSNSAVSSLTSTLPGLEKGLTMSCATAGAVCSPVCLVCPSITSLQSSPSTACKKVKRLSLASMVSPCTSSYRFSPIALRIFSFFPSYSASSASEKASVSTLNSSHISRPAALFPGGVTPSSTIQSLTSASMFERLAMDLLANTITRVKAHVSAPRRLACVLRATTTLREYPTYWTVFAESYTAYTPKGFSASRAST
mmetsp:Transcript_12809/g.21749  ORF Transcript_12809/g.21749 Transcript_12809/m.21749 type:complete len:231 (-) Transcript_12809:503-1195(-)